MYPTKENAHKPLSNAQEGAGGLTAAIALAEAQGAYQIARLFRDLYHRRYGQAAAPGVASSESRRACCAEDGDEPARSDRFTDIEQTTPRP